MRITLDTLARADPPMTVRATVLSAVRKGVYPWVAAEAAGVSRKQFTAWMRAKKGRLRQFAIEVRKARGWARVQAEMALYENDPRFWLKSGPGRETDGKPGWTKDVPPPTRSKKRKAHPLSNPAWRDLLAKMLDALTPYPEARTALAQMLGAESDRGRGGEPKEDGDNGDTSATNH